MNDWLQVRISFLPEAMDAVLWEMDDLGIDQLEVEHPEDFQEFLEHETAHWDFVEEELLQQKKQACSVTCYLPGDGQPLLAEIQSRVEQLQQTYCEMELTTQTLREEDWANTWKEFYKPRKIGERLVVCPIWETYQPQGDEQILWLDPGVAFGTGNHETTSLCLELLERLVYPHCTVLDIGCGSGILSIAALKLGAETATAVDIDPLAVKIAAENAEKNDLFAPRYRAIAGNLTDQIEGTFDLIVSNIVADVILDLTQTIRPYLNRGGYWICSGIIAERAEEVRCALQEFTVLEELQRGDWFAFAVKE